MTTWKAGVATTGGDHVRLLLTCDRGHVYRANAFNTEAQAMRSFREGFAKTVCSTCRLGTSEERA